MFYMVQDVVKTLGKEKNKTLFIVKDALLSKYHQKLYNNKFLNYFFSS